MKQALFSLFLILLVVGYFYVRSNTDSNRGSEDILSAIPSDAPLEIKVKKKNDLQKAAREAPYLEIKDCKPAPRIIKVVNKSSLIVKNSGDQDRTIAFNKMRFKIPARDQISINLDFAKEELHPWYWYICDVGNSKTAGLIWVVFTYFKMPDSLRY